MVEARRPAGPLTPPPLYRPCVGVALFDARGRVFIGRRPGNGNALTHPWQMPQGGIDPHEDAVAAAMRELYEETNIRSVAVLAETQDWLTYDLPNGLAKRAWKGRYRGQAQRWVALRFTGTDDEIDVLHPAGGAHKPEFRAWRWERLDRTPELVVPFKRPVYEEVARRFAVFAQQGGRWEQ